MDVKIFSAFLLISFSVLFYSKAERVRVLCVCSLSLGIFLFFLSRSLETVAASFLISIVMAIFSFKESFSVVDYRKEKSEWVLAKEFFERKRFGLMSSFALFNVAFLFAYSIFKRELLSPVSVNQVLSQRLGAYVISSHWIGVFVLFVVSAILLNVSGRKGR